MPTNTGTKKQKKKSKNGGMTDPKKVLGVNKCVNMDSQLLCIKNMKAAGALTRP